MDAAALAVSIIAILIALASAAYSRRMANIARDHRHDEVAPTVKGAFDEIGQGDVVFVTVARGLRRYDSVALELILDAQGRADPLVAIADPETRKPMTRVELGPVETPRELIVFAIRHGDGGGGAVRFRAHFRNRRREWTVPLEVEVPPKWDPSMRVLSF